jgi:mycothiol S-conjugate amidase
MCVHAHPDDESSKGAATMARYVDEGIEVLVVTCTGGERGDILNPALKERPDLLADVPGVRRHEMAEAARILGVEHAWLGFIDSGLPEGDPLPPLPEDCFANVSLAEATAPLVALIRSFRPQVMTTYDEHGGYPHPDHIMTHNISVAAYEAAGDPAAYPDAGRVWSPQKLYYDIGFSRDRIAAMHKAILDAGEESPFTERLAELAKTAADRREPTVTTRIYCADTFSRRDDALRAHATQVDPAGWFFKVPLETQAKIWPWELFELAQSSVETELPEDDLFAGIRAEVSS